MAVGLPVKMDRVKDFQVNKPWCAVRSRFELEPDSGGVNGQPSLANQENVQRMRDQIVRRLAERVRHIIDAERDSLPAKP